MRGKSTIQRLKSKATCLRAWTFRDERVLRALLGDTVAMVQAQAPTGILAETLGRLNRVKMQA